MNALAHVDAEKTVLGCMLSDPESLYRVLPLLPTISLWTRIGGSITQLQN